MNGPLVNLTVLLGAGFALGIRHALDADHVAAVSTLVGETRSVRRSTALGLWWGIGHTATLLVAGLLLLLFRVSIPARFTPFFELAVGAVLIALGIRAFRNRHGLAPHAHHFLHATTPPPPRFRNGTRSLALGVVHGLAGSASLTLLVLATVPSPLWGALYLLAFGLGSIASMVTASAVISIPFVLAPRHRSIALTLRTTTAVLSIALGVTMVGTFALAHPLTA